MATEGSESNTPRTDNKLGFPGEDDIKRWVKDVVGPLLSPINSTIGSVSTDVKRLADIPKDLETLEKFGRKTIFPQVSEIVSTLERVAENNLTFNDSAGYELKQAINGFAETLITSVGRLKEPKINGTPLVDSALLDAAVGPLKQVKQWTWAISDTLVAPLASVVPADEVKILFKALDDAIGKLESAVSSLTAPVAAALQEDNRKTVVIAITVVASICSLIHYLFDYFLSAIPLAVGVEAGPVVADASLTVMQVTPLFFGGIKFVAGFLYNLLSLIDVDMLVG